MNLSLKKISEWLSIPQDFEDVSCEGICLDSREVTAGKLFIAITGEHFDGHDFISQAQENGARAIIASQPIHTSLPTLYVKDTRKALGEIAKKWREQWLLPVICVTGSCGKTTTKAMIANILQQIGKGLATAGTLNNDIGLPLTVLKLTAADQYAVFELGANHLNEITYLANIAHPTVAVITNAASVHLEGFGSIEGVAKAKSEIYQALPETGIAVLNKDDYYAPFWRDIIGTRKIITFGTQNKGTDISAREIVLDKEGFAQFILVTPTGEISIRLPLLGKHHVSNALAAVAASFALYSQLKKNREIKYFLEDVKKGLESLSPIYKRLVVKKALNGTKILDDSYNANPLALSAALEVLAHHSGEKILVLGDMSELGEQTEACHKEAGYQAKKLGVKALYAVGNWSQFAAEAFGDNGYHFKDKQKLIIAVRDILKNDMVILVKGSRGAKMEEVVAALTENL